MENSRLLIELCECVIDRCLGHRRTLVACALTCSKWRPRSQYNLFQEVYLQDSEAFIQIMETFEAKPEFAGYVRELKISAMDYAPLALVLGSPLLKNCQRLQFNTDIYWDFFPPNYVQKFLVPSLTNMLNMVDFEVSVNSTTSASNFFHVIWAMPQLRHCTIRVIDARLIANVASLHEVRDLALKIQHKVLVNLRSLTLLVSSQLRLFCIVVTCFLGHLSSVYRRLSPAWSIWAPCESHRVVHQVHIRTSPIK